MTELVSKRLTIGLRIRLRDMLLDHRFGEERKEIKERRTKLAVAVYFDLYETALSDMLKLPAGWLPERDNIDVRFGTEYTNLDLDTARRMQNRHARACAAVYDAKHPLSVEFAKIERAEDDLRAREKALHQKVKTSLAKFTSTRQLIEAWPEIESFVRKLDGGSGPRSLPMVPVSQLNDLLRLPPDAEAAAT